MHRYLCTYPYILYHSSVITLVDTRLCSRVRSFCYYLSSMTFFKRSRATHCSGQVGYTLCILFLFTRELCLLDFPNAIIIYHFIRTLQTWSGSLGRSFCGKFAKAHQQSTVTRSRFSTPTMEKSAHKSLFGSALIGSGDSIL